MSKHNLPRSIVSLRSRHRLFLLPSSTDFHRTLQTTSQSHVNQTENARPILDARSLAAEPPPSNTPRLIIKRHPTGRTTGSSDSKADQPPSNAPRFTIRRHPTGKASGPSDSNQSSRPIIDARSLAADRPPSNIPRFAIRRHDTSVSPSNDKPSKLTSRPPRKPSRPSFSKNPRSSPRTKDSSSASTFNYKARLAAFEEERATYKAERAELTAPKPVPIEPQLFEPTTASGAQIQTGITGMKDVWAVEMEKVRWVGELQARGWKGWRSGREKEEGEARLKRSDDVVEKLLSGKYPKEGLGEGKGVVKGGVERVVWMNSTYRAGDEKKLVGRVRELVERPRGKVS